MKEVLQIAYLRHLQDFYLFESVKDGIIAVWRVAEQEQNGEILTESHVLRIEMISIDGNNP